MRKMMLWIAALILIPSSVWPCASSDGFVYKPDEWILTVYDEEAWDKWHGLITTAQELASVLCDVDNDQLQFAAKITFSIHLSGYTVVQVHSFHLATALKKSDDTLLRNLATIYGKGALQLGPVFVQFFHVRADDGGKARVTFRLTLDANEKLKIERERQ